MKRAAAAAGLVLLLGLTGCGPDDNQEARLCIKDGGNPVWVMVGHNDYKREIYRVQCHAKEEK